LCAGEKGKTDREKKIEQKKGIKKSAQNLRMEKEERRGKRKKRYPT